MRKKILFTSLLNIFFVFSNICIRSQCFKSIEGGGVHTLGLKSDGTLWAWGQNYSYQLGNESLGIQRSPIKIGNDNTWSMIAAGELYSVGIKSDGTLWGWGDNYKGVLGDGTQTARKVPTKIGSATDWKFVDAGYDFTVAIKNDGTLWTWGNNIQGQLGDGANTESLTPKKIGTDTDWLYVYAGYQHAVAIKTNGTIWSWGYNLYGQLGDGTKNNTNKPKQIGNSSDWKKIATKTNHTLALKNDGTIWAWGSNYSGEIGNNTVTYADVLLPEQIGADSDWKDIFASNASSHAIKNDGSRWGWGSNGYAEQGNGNNVGVYTKPTKIGTDNNWKMIFTGTRHVFGFQDNSLVGWGYNNYNQVGEGTVTTFIKSPANIGCAFLQLSEASIIKRPEIYPNPVKDFIFITNHSKADLLARIFDLNGRKIKEVKNVSDGKIDLRELQKGNYIIELNDGKNIYKQKIIKN